MAETLVIHYLPENEDFVSWAFVNDQGALSSNIQQGSIQQLSPLAKGRKAHLLIDASSISLHSVKIPSQSRQRQLQAVPFVLEDILADDIDSIHFALAKKQSNDTVPVATINKQLLHNILERFKQADIDIATASADLLALPVVKDGWTILLQPNSALIKTGHYSGYYFDRDNLSLMLSQLIEQTEQPPASIELLHSESDDHAADKLSSFDIALNINTYQAHVLEIFSANLTDSRQLNLLQGDFAPKKESLLLLKPWKAVASLAGVLLILQLIYAGIETRLIEQQNRQLQSGIVKQFKRALPNAKKTSNMRNRVKGRLKELQGGGSSDANEIFLSIMAQAATALSSNKNININAMVYRNKHIDIELQADSLQTLESIKTKLAAIRQIKTTLSTSIEKDKVKGRLRLERQS